MSEQTYLLPANLEPLDDFCAKVYIPDEDIYRQAFLGAYISFGTWVVWKRDRNRSAAIAAARWRESIEKTLLEWGNGCGCGEEDDMTQEEVTALIKEILDAMTITITNTNNCGCGCGGNGTGNGAGDSGVDYRIPPPGNPTLPPPDETTPPQNPNDGQKCAMANYLVYTLRLTLLRIQESGGNYPDFSTWYAGLFAPVVETVYAIAYQTWQWAKQWFTGDAADVSAIFDQFYNTYVCALFSATSAQMAQDNITAALGGTLGAYEDLSHTARIVAAELPFGLLFQEAGAIDIPIGFGNQPCCGESQNEVEPLPPMAADSGYTLAYIASAEITEAATNNSADVTYNEAQREFTHIALDSQLNYHNVSISILIEDLIARNGYQSAHGFVFMFTSSTLTGEVAISLPTSTGGEESFAAVQNKQVIYHQNDEYANVPEFKDYVDQYTFIQNYGNGQLTNGHKNSFKSQSYTTSLSPSFKVRVWAICKV